MQCAWNIVAGRVRCGSTVRATSRRALTPGFEFRVRRLFQSSSPALRGVVSGPLQGAAGAGRLARHGTDAVHSLEQRFTWRARRRMGPWGRLRGVLAAQAWRPFPKRQLEWRNGAGRTRHGASVSRSFRTICLSARATIRRRYTAGLKNLRTLYLPLANSWKIIDNTRIRSPRLIAAGKVGLTEVYLESVWHDIMEQEQRP